MQWYQPRGVKRTVSFLKEVSMTCAALGGPTCQAINKLVQDERFRDVFDFDIKYDEGVEYNDLVYARQIKALVEKQDFLDLGFDPSQSAFHSFLAAEEKCRLTNDRLRNQRPTRDVSAVLYYATRKIADILGPVPSLSDLSFRFGPGATANVVGEIANFRSKLSAPLSCSEDMLPIVGDFLAEFPNWADAKAFSSPLEDVLLVSVQLDVGKLVFVPKTSKTHRPICVEPTLNALMQKGIGSHMKKRLLAFGVNLFDQSRNRNLARIGSEDGSLATVDLSSASDTISHNLVLDLLPFDWFELLSNCRTGKIQYRGKQLVLEKFSAMGNGYTFELESLIFSSLVYGCMQLLGIEGVTSTYGDDLIVPVGLVPLLCEVLDYCGFDVNTKKSFWSGPFRESCGADWYAGLDIRPFYLREEISDRVLFVAHNFFIRHAEPALARVCLRWTQKRHRLFGPDGYGDGHLIGAYTVRTKKRHVDSGYDGGTFLSYKANPRRVTRQMPCDHLIPHYVAYSYANGERDAPISPSDVRSDPYVVRGSRGYKKVSIYTHRRGIFT